MKSNDRRIDPVGACVGMRGSRIQAIVRELNNEKIDIINHSEKSEILITRALSPAVPLNLYIDDERKYCIAIFNDDEIDFAIGRGGLNVNLASNVTNYRIDAFGKNEYERKKQEDEKPLAEIEGISSTKSDILAKNSITNISDLLNADEDFLLSIKGMSEKAVESIYGSVQAFIEKSREDYNLQIKKAEEISTDVLNTTKTSAN